MGLFSSDKPYTAISSSIDRLTARGDGESEAAELLELIELVQINIGPGTAEAGRALRKKLKHGSQSEQLRALSITEMLVDNGGTRITGMVSDSGLGEYMVQVARSGESRPKKRAAAILHSWSLRKDSRISGLFSQAGLGAGKPASVDPTDRSRSRGRERSASSASATRGGARGRSPISDDEDERQPRLPTRPAARDRSPSRSPSPLNVRGASLTTTIATGHSVATRLTNSLILNDGNVGHSKETAGYFRQAKQMRRLIINLIHKDAAEVAEYLDQLLQTNEELVEALQAHDAALAGKLPVRRDAAAVHDEDYERMDTPSPEPALNLGNHRPPPVRESPLQSRHVSPPSRSVPSRPAPSRPAPVADNDDDEDEEGDPFADANEDNKLPQNTPVW